MNVLNAVVITIEGSPYGLRVLNALHRKGIRPANILVQSDTFSRKRKLLRSVARRIGWRDAVVSALRKLSTEREWRRTSDWRGAPLITDYAQLAVETLRVGNCHDPEALDRLERQRPDLILLAHSGIVRPVVIAKATIGVLNGHPGVLPYYRGIDSAWWALYDGAFDRLGSTLHLVDAGIDTGPIVAGKTLRLERHHTFDGLELVLYEDCADLLADACVACVQGEPLRATPQTLSLGRQYYKMNRSQMRQAEQNFSRLRQRLASTTRRIDGHPTSALD